MQGKFLGTLCDITQRALNIIENWCKKVGLSVNPNKTELIIFTKKRNLTDFRSPKIFGQMIKPSESVKYLGVTFTPKLNWNTHIEHRINKCLRTFWCCRRAIGRNWGLSPQNILWLLTAIVRPMLSYGAFIWWEGTLTATNQKKLNHLQRVICLAITGAAKSSPTLALETILHLPPLESFIQAEARMTAFRMKAYIKPAQAKYMGHHSILDQLYEYDRSLQAFSDKCDPMYIFQKTYRVVYPSVTSSEQAETTLEAEVDLWFTDASINENGSGYGVYSQTQTLKFVVTLANWPIYHKLNSLLF